MVRCFAAIELPDDVRALALQIRRAVVAADGRWRNEKWVAEDNLHMTVAFYGDVDEKVVSVIANAIRSVPVRPFVLTSPGFSAIPSAHEATMAWLSFADRSGDATALASLAGSAAEGLANPPADRSRNFKPHVTLVRARRPLRLSADARSAVADLLADAGRISMSVPSVSVFASTLTPTGPRYELLEKVPLQRP